MGTRQLSAAIEERTIVKPRLKVRYPKVTGLPHMAQRIINAKILDLTYRLIRDQGYLQTPNMEITGRYSIELNERGFLSLTLENYAYVEGAAHGLTIRKSLTADLRTGKVYQLEDLFKRNTNFETRLNNLIRRQIKEQDMPLINEFKGVKRDQDYYLTPKELFIYFQLYELAPYAWGFPTFRIPYAQIADLIDPEGPVGRLYPPSR